MLRKDVTVRHLQLLVRYWRRVCDEELHMSVPAGPSAIDQTFRRRAQRLWLFQKVRFACYGHISGRR